MNDSVRLIVFLLVICIIYLYFLCNTCTSLLSGSTIKVGDKVRVKPSVTMPTYKWGSVTHRSVGTVTGKERTSVCDEQINQVWTISKNGNQKIKEH